MSRRTLGALFAGLALMSMLALAAPARGEAAGSRGGDPGPSLADLVPRWIVGLMEKIGLRIAPDGSVAPPEGDGGTATTTGDGGDIGWGIDPDG